MVVMYFTSTYVIHTTVYVFYLNSQLSHRDMYKVKRECFPFAHVFMCSDFPCLCVDPDFYLVLFFFSLKDFLKIFLIFEIY